METRANFVLIGAFTLAVIAGAFLFVLWFSGLTRISEHKTYEVLFTGTVSGLSQGSAVLFDGLRDRRSHADRVSSRPIPAKSRSWSTSPERSPINKDTKARLEIQGLTGGAAIALTGGAPDAPPLLGRERRAADHRRRTFRIAEYHGERAEPFRQGRIGAGQGGQTVQRQPRRHRRRDQERRHLLEGAQRQFGGDQLHAGGFRVPDQIGRPREGRDLHRRRGLRSARPSATTRAISTAC